MKHSVTFVSYKGKNMKTCSKCKKSKEIEQFGTRKDSLDGRQGVCIECRTETNRIWRLKNKDRAKSNEKAYREANKEKIEAYRKEYYQNNKDKVNAQKKEYNKRKKDEIKAKRKKYREANKEIISAKLKAYAQSEHGKLVRKNCENKRRFLKNITSDGSVPLNIKFPLNSELESLMETQKYKCVYCKEELTQENSHLDHIVPLSKKGTHTIDNIQFLCPSCNLQKGSLSEDEFIAIKDKQFKL